MARTKKKFTKEEQLAKDRERKKLKYAEMKSDPERYRMFQEKEKRRYLVKKERKKVVGIQEMSERAKREQRRRWRKNSLTYLKKQKENLKLQQILIENSPPESENEEVIPAPQVDQHDPLADKASSPVRNRENKPSVSKNENTSQLKKIIRRVRYNHQKVLNELKVKMNILQKKNEALRKNQCREEKENSKLDTLEKKVDSMIKDIKEDKIKQVKRKLLFSETVTQGFCEKYKKTNKGSKRSVAECVLTKRGKLETYRVVSQLPFSLRKIEAERLQGKKEALLKLRVKQFLEEDVNSQMAAGKKESIKRNGIRKQKRSLKQQNRGPAVKLFISVVAYVSDSARVTTAPIEIDELAMVMLGFQCSSSLKMDVGVAAKAIPQQANHSTVKVKVKFDVYETEVICCDSWSKGVKLGESSSSAGAGDGISLFTLVVNISVQDVTQSMNISPLLLNDNNFRDLNLIATDAPQAEPVKVHKVVMASHSERFRNLLTDPNRAAERDFPIGGVTYETLVHLRDYMYNCILPDPGIPQLLLLAISSEMNKLKDECIRKLTSEVRGNDLDNLIEFAIEHRIPDLLRGILSFTPDSAVQQAHMLRRQRLVFRQGNLQQLALGWAPNNGQV